MVELMDKEIKKILDNIPNISIRVNKKQLINQLRAMQDNCIELLINTKDTKVIMIKDRYNLNKMITNQ